MRYLCGLVWFIVISFATSMILGVAVAAYIHFSGTVDLANPPAGASGFAFGEAVGRLTSPIGFLVGLIAAIVGTAKEMLPGTKRKRVVRREPIKYDHLA